MANQVRVDELIENSSPSLNDKLMGIGTSYEYQTLVADVARKIVEDYAGSSLGGTSRTLKEALDAISTKLGNTNMGTSATTVTGAIAEHEGDISGINTKIGNVAMGTAATTVTGAIKEHNNKIGDASMGTTATTLTGAIAEHEEDIFGIGGAITDLNNDVDSITSTIGTTPMGTTATTVKGAIAEHEGDISGINTSITNINDDINDIDGFIGNAQMGTTAETLTGAIAEHEADIIELSSASVSYTLPELLGVKNLVPYPHVDTTQEVDGIIFTDIGDGTIMANGTATDDVSYTIADSTTWKTIAEGTYALTGCPTGGSTNTYYIRGEFVDGATNRTMTDIGSGITASFDNNVSISEGTLAIYIKSGTTVTDLVFSPMFRIANIENDTYEKYHNPNIGDIWDDIHSIDDTIGNTSMGTTATTLTGAIAEHEEDISTLNSNLVKVALTRTSAASRGEGFLIYDPAKKSVRIYATFYNATAIANNAVLFTVPSGYRPPSNVNVMCFYQSTSGGSAYVAPVNVNGNVVNSLGATTISGLIVGEYLLQ